MKMEKIYKKISYISQIIDSAIFMASSFSSFANNLADRIHAIKCKFRQMIKNAELVELDTEIVTSFPNT